MKEKISPSIVRDTKAAKIYDSKLPHKTLNQLSKIINVPPDTLRYWAECGLISRQRNESNGYYYFTLSNIPSICQVVLLRKLDCSIAEIKQLEFKNTEEQRSFFAQKLSDLDVQFNDLLQKRKQVVNIINDIDNYNKNKDKELYWNDIPFDFIEDCDINDTQSLLRMLAYESHTITMRKHDANGNVTSFRGLSLTKEAKNTTPIIWTKKPTHKFLSCIIDRSYLVSPIQFEAECLKKIQEMGYHSDTVLYKSIHQHTENNTLLVSFLLYFVIE